MSVRPVALQNGYVPQIQPGMISPEMLVPGAMQWGGAPQVNSVGMVPNIPVDERVDNVPQMVAPQAIQGVSAGPQPISWQRNLMQGAGRAISGIGQMFQEHPYRTTAGIVGAGMATAICPFCPGPLLAAGAMTLANRFMR